MDQIDDGAGGVQTFGIDEEDERLDNMLIEDGMTLEAGSDPFQPASSLERVAVKTKVFHAAL